VLSAGESAHEHHGARGSAHRFREVGGDTECVPWSAAFGAVSRLGEDGRAEDQGYALSVC
jgi:hypothetical protein